MGIQLLQGVLLPAQFIQPELVVEKSAIFGIDSHVRKP